MTSVYDWMGQRVTAIEAAAFQRGLTKAVWVLINSDYLKSGSGLTRVALQDLARQILDSKDESDISLEELKGDLNDGNTNI